MNERDEVLLRDMLDAARDVRTFSMRLSLDVIQEDRLLALGLTKAIEIVGEAATRISTETRAALPQIPWKDIVGMRHKVVHDYDQIHYGIVWETAITWIPELIEALEAILPPEPDDTPPR